MRVPATAPLESTIPVSWADPARAAAFAAWLQGIAGAHAWRPASVRLASADASFRRYLRVDRDAGGSMVIMDAPPDKEDCRPFVHVDRLLLDAGLNAPRIHAWDEALGFMLMDDLGSRTMIEDVGTEPTQETQRLYLRAVDALIAWQLASRPQVLPPYDAALLAHELALFPDRYHKQQHDNAEQNTDHKTQDTTNKHIVERNLASPSVYVHRDFMPRNLM